MTAIQPLDSKIREVLAFLLWADDEHLETVSYGDVAKAFSFWNTNTELNEQHPCTPQLKELLTVSNLVDQYLDSDGERAFKLTAVGRDALMTDLENRKLASPDLRLYTWDFAKELCPGCHKVTPLLLYPKDHRADDLPLIMCVCGYLMQQNGTVLCESRPQGIPTRTP